jgi:hypothetical protein
LKNSVARRNSFFCRLRYKLFRYFCELECEWNLERLCSSRHNFCRWSLYGAWGFAAGRDDTSDCHKPRRLLQIGLSRCDHYQRYRDRDFAIFLKCGIRSRASFPCLNQQQWHPDATARWSLSGSVCPGSCGSIDASRNYIAPAILPNSTSVLTTAVSAADPTKQNSASITVTSNFTLQVSVPASMATGVTTAIIVNMTAVPGSHPSGALSWSLSGTGCSGISCGILTIITTQSAGPTSFSDTANYTAPQSSPQPFPVMATLAGNHRTTLMVSESDVSENLNWMVKDIAGGNSTFGQICAVGSSPCQSIISRTSLQVEYCAGRHTLGTGCRHDVYHSCWPLMSAKLGLKLF